MKVIHIITGLATGGAENALYNILSGGLNERFENHVVSLSDLGTIGPKLQEIGVPVTILGMRSSMPSFAGLSRLRRVIKDFQPDLIQGWMYHGNLAAKIAKNFARKNCVLCWNVRQTLYDIKNEKWMTRMVIRLNRFLSASPDRILYNSHLAKKQHEIFGFKRLRSQVIPNGINVDKFDQACDKKNTLRVDLKIPEGTTVVGHAARYHPMKDHRTFILASISLARRFTQIHFVMCGSNVTYDNDDLASLVPTELRPRIHMLGERSDIPELFKQFDIFCLSSAWGEGFPNVLGEAMAAKVPCVTTDVGDSQLVVGDSGIVVKSGNVDELETGLKKLVQMSTEQRSEMGDEGRARILKEYALSSVVDQYSLLYSELTEHNASS